MGLYRKSLTHFAETMVREWTQTLLFFVVLLLLVTITKRYSSEYVFNLTPSIEGKLYRMTPDKSIERERVVVFPFKHAVLPHGVEHLTKKVLCLPGDILQRVHLEFFCNGRLIARAKTHTNAGAPLEAFNWSGGHVPAGVFFAGSPHPDGFDSRYVGLIPLSSATVLERVL